MYKITFILLFLCGVVTAQNVQSPQEYFGHKYGEKFHFHSQVVEYAKYISLSNKDNTKLLPYGKTSEGRDLFVIAFGSKENIANLDNIRKANLQNIGILSGQGQQNIPAITMLSYNVHGNEAVNTEIALQLIHELGGWNTALNNAVFKNSIILIDPCANPDGFDRYSQWYNRHVGKKPNPNPDAIEHREPWPGGRYNHYHVDMNRDLAWQTQLETQQRVNFYNSWMPHFHGDFHEMGPSSSYFFAPSAKPFHEDFTPYQREFQNLIGNYHKKEFDKNGWLYYTKERFDLLYPSYGDTYPSYNGAIAMTYEQGGSGVAGLSLARSEGDTLTLEERMKHSYATSIAAIEAVSENAENIKAAFNKYFNDATKNGYGKYKSYVLKGNTGSITALTELLNKIGIKYSFASGKSSLNGFSYKNQKNEGFSLEKEDLIVNTYQPKGIFTKILFEPHTMLEDSNTYDITAWALPYVYGLEAYGLTQKLEGNSERGSTIEKTSSVGGNHYAYALKLEKFDDYKFLSAALQAGINSRVQPAPFQINGKTFPSGTVIFTKLNDRKLDAKLNEILKSNTAYLEPISSGLVEKGMDLGLDEVSYIGAPRVGVLMGAGVSPTAFGDVWHYFDQQINYPVTLLDNKAFNNVKLSNYDVLVLPGGRYDKSLVESQELQGWVNRGGRLILLENACAAFEGVEGYELKEKTQPEAKPNLNKKYGTYSREVISDMVPGAIFEIKLDNTHPLAYGYGETMNLLIKDANNYEFLTHGWNVGTIGQLKSGFVGSNLKKSLKDVPVFGVQDKGRGKVIYLTESPIFRGFWYTGKALFANAVFFVK